MDIRIERFMKLMNISLAGIALCLMFTIGLAFGLYSNPSATTDVVNTEEILMEKSNLIDKVVQYEEGLNPYFSTSKSNQLVNLSTEKLEKLVDSGYVVYIVNTQSNDNLAEPVKIEGNQIIVSTHSNDGALIDTVNQLLAQNK